MFMGHIIVADSFHMGINSTFVLLGCAICRVLQFNMIANLPSIVSLNFEQNLHQESQLASFTCKDPNPVDDFGGSKT
ncbi:hypothetical protein SCA6_003343 [Theobroma cacao]